MCAPPLNPTCFVVLSTQRSGTTWLIEMLNSHPQVMAYGELFVEDGHGSPRRGAQDQVFWETHRSALATVDRQQAEGTLINEYLDKVYAPRSGIEAVGFKLMYGQAGAYPAVCEYVRSRGATVIHLVRRNVLDIVLSKNAAVMRRMFSAEKRQEIAPVSMQLNISNLLTRLEDQEREVRKGRAIFDNAGVPFYEFVYEDLVAGTTSFSDVLMGLGVRNTTRPLNTAMVKMNTQAHQEIIANYAEVRQVLQSTRFASMLN